MNILDNNAKFDIFPWNNKFETGIKNIDEQHIKLVEILNRLAVHLANRSSSVLLDSIFDELVSYTDYHFKSEEVYWNKYLADTPLITSHQHVHNSFVNEIIELKNKKTNKATDDTIREIVSFLTHWLAYHILDSDKRMAYVVKQLENGATYEQAKEHANRVMADTIKPLVDTILDMYDSLSVRTLDLMREKALRKRAEQALLLSEKRWDFIIEGSEESIWEWNISDGKMENSTNNNPFLNILIQNDNKLNRIKSGNIIKIYPEDIDNVNRELQNHFDGKTNFFTTKYRVVRENTSWSWINSKGKVIERDSDGTALKMIGTHTDITERELGALIFRQTYQPIIVVNLHFTIKNINQALTVTTGFGDNDIVGKEFFSFFLGNDTSQNIESIKQEIRNNGFWLGEVLIQRKNGQMFTALTSILSLRKTDEPFDYFVIMFTDISDRIEIENKLLKAKEKAEESDQLKTAFLNNLSHEIRTPMNAICGFSDMLTNPDLSDEKRNSFVTIIQKSSNQLLSIITDILTISSIETKQVKINIEKVTLNNILINLLNTFKPLAQSHNVSLFLKQQLESEHSEIFTDKTKITQILTNLLSNAVKFTNKGQIEFGYNLKSDIEPREIEFYVKDTGIGIIPEIQSVIFEHFRQADTVHVNYGGSGLGLSISKGFVELLSGKIWVVSELEKGSTFYFTIPYKPVNEINKSITTTKQNENFKTVLVAEDEEYNFLFIEELLIGMDLKLIHAKNGKETVEIFKANPKIDLILMDIKMPIMTGHEAATIIKQLKPSLPIIAQSAYALEHEIAKYEGIFDDYLTKPINKDKLKQTIMKYI